MNPFLFLSTGKTADWLVFAAMLLLIGICIAGLITWIFLSRKSNKRKRKRRHRGHNRINPTLAQTGGLPPPRDPNRPPPGP